MSRLCCLLFRVRYNSKKIYIIIRFNWFLLSPRSEPPQTSRLIQHGQLVWLATVEIAKLVAVFVSSPKHIYEELFERRHYERNAVQTVSLSGRKLVAWSRPIHRDTTIEVHFMAMSVALQTLLEQYSRNTPLPDRCAVCVRSVGSEQVLGRNNKSTSPTASGGGNAGGGGAGYVCMNLPMRVPTASHGRRDAIRKSFEHVRRRQIGLYAVQAYVDHLTAIVPALSLQVLFNYLSKKFAITITAIDDKTLATPIASPSTMWGHRIVDVIVFRQPQSNIGVSLTLQQFGDHTCLSVMSDAQFSPHHTKIVDAWANYFRNL